MANVRFSDGKQIGRMKSVMGTRSLRRNSAMSLSKLEKLNGCEMARSTKRVSGRVLSSHRSCSPNVTLIMNHIKLDGGKTKTKHHVTHSIRVAPKATNAYTRCVCARAGLYCIAWAAVDGSKVQRQRQLTDEIRIVVWMCSQAGN